jgi:hypothetical protein
MMAKMIKKNLKQIKVMKTSSLNQKIQLSLTRLNATDTKSQRSHPSSLSKSVITS